MVEEKLEEAHNLVKDKNHILLDIMNFILNQKRVISFLVFLFVSIFLNASTLELSISANPTRLNPILATDSASSSVSDWIFSGLFKYDKNGTIITDMASSYYFEDNKTLIIKLRKDIKWHDGVKFDAKDVLFTYHTILSPKIFTPYASDYKKYIKNVVLVDNYTIKVIYYKPYFKALELWMMGILPEHILKNEKDLMTSDFNKHPIGTGPYKLKKVNFSNNILLKANQEYYDGKPKIEFINYKFIADSNTDFLLQKQGKLDISSLTPLQLDRQIDDKFRQTYRIIETQSFGYTYMGFNLKNPKFKDIRVREAINLAIDKQQLIDILFFGHAKVCNGPFLPGTFAYNSNIKTPKQNLQKAKKLLKEVGYDEKNPLEFEIVTNSGNNIRVNAAEILQYQLSLVGIKVHLRVLEWQAFLNTVINPRHFEAFILGWSMGLTPDARSIWHSSSDFIGGFNLVGFHNKEVDRLIDLGALTINRKKLAKIYKKIYAIIAQNLPYIFLYIPNSIVTVKKNIQNVNPALIGIYYNEKDWIKN